MLNSASPSAQLISEVQAAITSAHPTMSQEDLLIGVEKVVNRMAEQNLALSHVAMQMVIRNLPSSITIFKQDQQNKVAIGSPAKAEIKTDAHDKAGPSKQADQSISVGSILSKAEDDSIEEHHSEDSESSDLDNLALGSWEDMLDEFSEEDEEEAGPAESVKVVSGKAEVGQFVSMFDNMKSKTEANIRKFAELSTHGKLFTSKRMNQFVMTVGLPDLPRRHPGVDDSLHPYLDINFKWLNLLNLGNNTLKYIHHRNNKQSPCPNLLFLRTKLVTAGVEKDDDATLEIMANHMLFDFRTQILQEMQLPIEFHFAGHGTQQSVGTTESISGVGDQIRMEPEDFAEYFHRIVKDAGLKDKLKNSQKGVKFFFHTCNSAYYQHDDARDMSQQILEETIIGRFYQVMKAKGYKNFEVVGFRGFYQAMTNGSGARFSDSAVNDLQTLEISQPNAEYRISYMQKGQSEVTKVQKPTNKKYWNFDLIKCGQAPSLNSDDAGPSNSSDRGAKRKAG